MWATITGLFTKAWSFISGGAGEIIGIGAAILGALALVRKEGADSVRSSEMKQTLKNVEAKNEVEDVVNNLSDDAVTEQLRKQGELRD